MKTSGHSRDMKAALYVIAIAAVALAWAGCHGSEKGKLHDGLQNRGRQIEHAFDSF